MRNCEHSVGYFILECSELDRECRGKRTGIISREETGKKKDRSAGADRSLRKLVRKKAIQG
ncbi:MAG: hypothetical protein D3925_03395 [Candidatus Electrothrix sp. AR5]|nr:hypothetical protein [Candidatus Electrothrix sp. AR5]